MDFPYSGVLSSCRNSSTGLRMGWPSSEWCELVSRLSWRQAGHKADPPSHLSRCSSAPRWVTSQWQDRTTLRAFPTAAGLLALPGSPCPRRWPPPRAPSFAFKVLCFLPWKIPQGKETQSGGYLLKFLTGLPWTKAQGGEWTRLGSPGSRWRGWDLIQVQAGPLSPPLRRGVWRRPGITGAPRKPVSGHTGG